MFDTSRPYLLARNRRRRVVMGSPVQYQFRFAGGGFFSVIPSWRIRRQRKNPVKGSCTWKSTISHQCLLCIAHDAPWKSMMAAGWGLPYGRSNKGRYDIALTSNRKVRCGDERLWLSSVLGEWSILLTIQNSVLKGTASAWGYRLRPSFLRMPWAHASGSA